MGRRWLSKLRLHGFYVQCTVCGCLLTNIADTEEVGNGTEAAAGSGQDLGCSTSSSHTCLVRVSYEMSSSVHERIVQRW